MLKDKIEELGYNYKEFLGWQGIFESDNPVDDYIKWKEDIKTLVIDDKNFSHYFFDVRKYGPKPGQVLACYETKADLIEGDLKSDIINLLTKNDGAGGKASILLRKLAGATEKSSIEVVKSIINDLLNGLNEEDVAKKPYEMHCQYYFYTFKDCLPTNDPKWWSASLIDVRYNLPQEETDEL